MASQTLFVRKDKNRHYKWHVATSHSEGDYVTPDGAQHGMLARSVCQANTPHPTFYVEYTWVPNRPVSGPEGRSPDVGIKFGDELCIPCRAVDEQAGEIFDQYAGANKRDTTFRRRMGVLKRDMSHEPPRLRVDVPCTEGSCAWPVEDCEFEDINRGAVDALDFVRGYHNCSQRRLDNFEQQLLDIEGAVTKYREKHNKEARRQQVLNKMKEAGITLTDLELIRDIEPEAWDG